MDLRLTEVGKQNKTTLAWESRSTRKRVLCLDLGLMIRCDNCSITARPSKHSNEERDANRLTK